MSSNTPGIIPGINIYTSTISLHDMLQIRNIMNMMQSINTTLSPLGNDNSLDEIPANDIPASSNFIDELPEHVITEEEEDKECSICLQKFTKGDICIKLPCDDMPHYFHSGDNPDVCCGIKTWLRKSHTCPVCRTKFPTDETNAQNENTQEELIELPITIMNIFERNEEEQLQEALLASLQDQV